MQSNHEGEKGFDKIAPSAGQPDSLFQAWIVEGSLQLVVITTSSSKSFVIAKTIGGT